MITFSENYTLKAVTIQGRFSARTYIFFWTKCSNWGIKLEKLAVCAQLFKTEYWLNKLFSICASVWNKWNTWILKNIIKNWKNRINVFLFQVHTIMLTWQ